MPIVAQMEGLPANADTNAVVLAVRKILQKLKIKFWVHDFTYSAETDTKKCKIEFFAKQEATKAIDRITSKTQTIVGVPCDLKVTIVSENNGEGKKKDVERRDRSRSPISKEEANINKELEQLKKEKEELEKRKNELLKKKMTIDQDTKEDGTVAKEFIKPVKIQHTTLPKCATVETTLMDLMKPLAKPYIQKRCYQNFMQRMLVEIRMRLAMLFDESKVNRSSRFEAIMKAYRLKYPKEEDPETVEYIMKQIKLAFWAYKPKKLFLSGSSSTCTNPDPYEYEESEEEEDTEVENKGEENNKNGGDMADIENTGDMADNENTGDIADNENTGDIADNENTVDMADNENAGDIADNENVVDMVDNENKEETSQNDETPGTGAMAEDSNEVSDIVFEDGTDWNQEANKVAASTAS